MKLFSYLLITLIICSVGTQLLKTFFKTLITGKFNKKTLTADGDFPSSHSSLVSAITTVAWIRVINLSISNQQTDNALITAFGITVFTVITIRDALGVRRTVGILCEGCKKIISSNRETLDELNLKLPDIDKVATNRIQNNFEDIAKTLNIKSGHLPHEVVGGMFWGILISITISTYYYGFYKNFILGIISIFAYIIIMSIFLKYGFSWIHKIIKSK